MYEIKKFGWLQILADGVHLDSMAFTSGKPPLSPPPSRLSYSKAKTLKGKGHLNGCPLMRQARE